MSADQMPTGLTSLLATNLVKCHFLSAGMTPVFGPFGRAVAQEPKAAAQERSTRPMWSEETA